MSYVTALDSCSLPGKACVPSQVPAAFIIPVGPWNLIMPGSRTDSSECNESISGSHDKGFEDTRQLRLVWCEKIMESQCTGIFKLETGWASTSLFPMLAYLCRCDCVDQG
jgi:hypothetical protein